MHAATQHLDDAALRAEVVDVISSQYFEKFAAEAPHLAVMLRDFDNGKLQIFKKKPGANVPMCPKFGRNFFFHSLWLTLHSSPTTWPRVLQAWHGTLGVLMCAQQRTLCAAGAQQPSQLRI